MNEQATNWQGLVNTGRQEAEYALQNFRHNEAQMKLLTKFREHGVLWMRPEQVIPLLLDGGGVARPGMKIPYETGFYAVSWVDNERKLRNLTVRFLNQYLNA